MNRGIAVAQYEGDDIANRDAETAMANTIGSMSRCAIIVIVSTLTVACGARSDLRAPRSVDGGSTHASIAAVAVGLHHRCVLLTDETAWCEGGNDHGQLGDATRTGRIGLRRVSGLDGIVQLALGANHSCARLRDQSVWCWGDGSSGQGGNGDLLDRLAPERVPDLEDVVDLASGSTTLCAVRRDGSVWCWGGDATRQLGRAANAETCPHDPAPSPCGRVPQAVVGVAPAAVAVSLGETRSCALTRDGEVWCWGMSGESEPGTEYCPPSGWQRCAAAPWRINWPAVHVIATGGDWTCGIGEIAEVRCTRTGVVPHGSSPDWIAGAGMFLLSGAGGVVMVSSDRTDPQTSTVVDPTRVVQASAFALSTCLVTDRHELWCAPNPLAEMVRVDF